MELKNLKDKRILLFAPSFFCYEKHILKRLQDFGAAVDFFDERPNNNVYAKIFTRFLRLLMSERIVRYYKKIWKEITNRTYNIVFVINIEAMPKHFLISLKEKQKNAIFILYMWDSIYWKKNLISYIDFFDFVYSFDNKDCENLEGKMSFRPLFFLNEYKNITSQTDYKYDLAFVGSAHTDRYTILSKINSIAQSSHLSFFRFMYLQEKRVFYMYWIANRNFRKSRKADFSFKLMQKERIVETIEKSKIIVDIQGPKQIGLTMRTLEVLGARRKLITTNTEIANYDFYSPENILIIDRSNPQIPISFINEPYINNLPTAIYEKYSLDGWLAEIFQPIE